MKNKWFLAGMIGCCMAAALALAACSQQGGEEVGGNGGGGATEPEHTHTFTGGVCECGEQDATFTGDAVNYKLEAGVYTGKMTDGMPDGAGKIVLTDAAFEGTWEDGVPATGTKTFYEPGTSETVSVYTGAVDANYVCSGAGVMEYANGDKYEGGFAAGVYSGEGKYTFANGMYYQGEYENGMREGEGLFSWSTDGNLENGWLFEGTFKEDKAYFGKTTKNVDTGLIWYEGYMLDLNNADVTKAGTGYVYFSDSGCSYTGGMTVAAGLDSYLYQGEGTFEWPGSDLVGTFADGAPVSGTKTFYLENENINRKEYYVGAFVNWNYEGQGTYYYESGDVYAGGWANNLYSGEGKYTFANGMYYQGEYANGMREGEGLFTWSTDGNLENGWLFEGTFKENKANYGKTTTTKTTDLVWYEGYMLDLNVIDPSKVGTGYFDYGNGCWYEGEMTSQGALEGCLFQGEGTFSWSSVLGEGVYFVGTFANSQAVSGTKYWPQKTAGLAEYTGAFANTDSIDTAQAGSGKFLFENGDVYEGGLQATTADGSACTLTGTGLMTYAASALTGADFGLEGAAAEWKVAACYGRFENGALSGMGVWYFTVEGAPAGYLTGEFAGTERTGAIADDFAYELLEGYGGFSDSAPAAQA